MKSHNSKNLVKKQWVRVFAVTFLISGWMVSSARAQLWLGDWYPTVGAELVTDDNINRAPDGEGEKSDVIIRPSLRAEMQQEMAMQTFAHMAVYAEGAIHGKYDGLNYMEPGVAVGGRHMFGEGESAMSLLGELGLGYQFFDQDIRSGAVFDPRVELRIPIEERIELGFSYAYDTKFSSDNPIYDVAGHTLGLRGTVRVSDALGLVMGYQYRQGDTIIHERNAEGVLGEEIRGERLPLDTFKQRYTAVQLEDADTHTFEVGVRYEYDLYTTMNLRFRYEEIEEGSEKYPSTQLLLGVSHAL